ncbi:MAG: type 1 glutamine amidotransferase [Nitrospinota bacterium]
MKILAVKNISVEGPGTLGGFLEKSGCRMEIVNLEAGERLPENVDGYRLVLILGGPMNVYEENRYPFLRDELSLIESCVKSETKVLGLCLGGQLIARALGAKVTKNQKKEIGWFDLQFTDAGKTSPLFSGLPEKLKVFQWHGDTFDIPDGGLHLARSELCENQAFLYDNTALALQFHVEIQGANDVEQWCLAYREELERENGENALAEIIAATQKEVPTLAPIADRFYENILHWVGGAD